MRRAGTETLRREARTARVRCAARLAALAGLLAAPALEAQCTSGSTLLRVPEDCATVAAAVSAAATWATIDIAPGTYSFAGGPLVLDNNAKHLSFVARKPREVTFTGGGSSSIVRIAHTAGTSRPPKLFEGIRFVNGNYSDGTQPARAGAVSLLSAEASFVDCEFVNNAHTLSSSGGGALGLYGGSRAIVVRSRFQGNSARNQGAAIYLISNDSRGSSSAWVIGSSFVGNSVAGSGFTGSAVGGAIYALGTDSDRVELRVADSEFRGNRAGWAGGAIEAHGNWEASAPFCDFAAASADLILTHVAFVSNAADDSANPGAVPQTFGGAIHAEQCVRVRIYSSLLAGNEADWGGAISLDHARLEAEQTVFRDNRTTVPDTSALPVGGTINAFSRDTANLADPDRPEVQVVLRESVLRGALDGSPAADAGGCLRLAGDLSRWDAGGAASSLRSPLELTDTVLFDCAVDGLAPSSSLASGGGLESRLVDQDWTRVLLARSRADDGGATNAVGGGAALWDETISTWSNVVFSGNTAATSSPQLFVEAGDPAPGGGYDDWSATSTSPNGGLLIAAPSRRAWGGFPFAPESWLGFGWSGSSATLDGNALGTNPKNGLVAAGAGAHALAVAGLGSCARCNDSITAPAAPNATLTASPASITTGQSSTLSPLTTLSAGNFLTSVVDRGVGIYNTANPGVDPTVSPDASITYRYLAFTTSGGALAERRVFVGEPVDPDEPIYGGDFEIDLYGWSAVAD